MIERKSINKVGESVGEYLEAFKSYFNVVFHGSPHLLDVLEPRRANGNPKIPSENLHAVYATDLPPIAIFCAIKSRERALAYENSIYHYNWCDMIDKENSVYTIYFGASSNIINTLGDGYVYILDNDKFTYTDSGFVSPESCVPLASVKVGKSDLNYPIKKFTKERLKKLGVL